MLGLVPLHHMGRYLRFSKFANTRFYLLLFLGELKIHFRSQIFPDNSQHSFEFRESASLANPKLEINSHKLYLTGGAIRDRPDVACAHAEVVEQLFSSAIN